MYDQAKPFPLAVTYRSLHKNDIQQYWFIKQVELERMKPMVKPALWQQWYECKEFDLHTSRFRATQQVEGLLCEGKALKPKYDSATLEYIVQKVDSDGNMKEIVIQVPDDPSKYNLVEPLWSLNLFPNYVTYWYFNVYLNSVIF